jgi:hypothetical protein
MRHTLLQAHGVFVQLGRRILTSYAFARVEAVAPPRFYSITPRGARERKHILIRNQIIDLVPVFELIVEKFMTLVDNQTLIPHIPCGDAESAVAALDPPLWKSYPLHYFSYQATKISYLAQQISYSPRHFITTSRPPRGGRQRATIEAGPTRKTPCPTVVTRSFGMQNGVLCCSGHRPSK